MKVLLLMSVSLLCSVFLFGGDNYVQADEDVSVFTMSLLPSQIEFNPLYTYSSLEAQIYSALHEGLVGYDPQFLSPVPGLAQRWEVLEDGMLYRFYIHPQAYYSNGDKVLSSHFRDAWLKMLELGDDAPFGFLLDPVRNAAAYRLGEVRDSEDVGISAPAANILDVQLEYPAGYFLSILPHHSLVALHPHALTVRAWSRLRLLP